MTRFEGTRHGKLIASQMLDVTIRVKDVRPFSVRQMVTHVHVNYKYMLQSVHSTYCKLYDVLTCALIGPILSYHWF